MKKQIMVKDVKDIQKINYIVSQYAFDIWIHSDTGMVDAKSILGLFMLSLNEPMYLVIDDNADPSKLFKDLEPYLTINE